MQKRCEQLERINGELKSKLDELTALYEVAQRDNRQKATEIIRLNHELDKTREQKDQLTRENKKLGVGMHMVFLSLTLKTNFKN